MTPDRCPECHASYARFRAGMSTADAAWSIRATVGGIDRDEGRIEDERHELGAGNAMVLAGQVKRAAWNEAHGPGRCRFDVEGWIMSYRSGMDSVVVLADREWRLAELMADLLLDEDESYSEPSDDADASFDLEVFDAVPMFIDDGNATSCIAA